MFTVGEIAARLQGEVAGDPTVRITGLAPANSAGPGDLTFAENEKYLAAANQTEATAVIAFKDAEANGKTLIRVSNVRVALAKALAYFKPEPSYPGEIHATSVVDPSAEIDPSAYIGPYCVIGKACRIGPRATLLGQTHIGDRTEIGAECRVFANVSIYADTKIGDRVRIHAGTVIGSDGYGYVFDQGAHQKIPQVGNVVIENDVEIGSNVSIDCGALGSTVVGAGTKIDNLVQIAHNVATGEHCLVISQSGIAGSSKLGKYVTLAGQVGIAGHLTIGDKVTLAAKSGVMHDIPPGETWMGAPAQPDRRTKRQLLALQQLPDLIRRVRQLEKESAKFGDKSSQIGD
ncbi:MAG: UDP-3-O-(3-hydroxymyristoyl)glucosamine N-acyltransferase [Verrucomicrobiales bacterium]|nr:UDP-3-O-(3-hydroxymyristoyl)glucosamine N-acyltransferase [Verrucomicrobiales bacterium]